MRTARTAKPGSSNASGTTTGQSRILVTPIIALHTAAAVAVYVRAYVFYRVNDTAVRLFLINSAVAFVLACRRHPTAYVYYPYSCVSPVIFTRCVSIRVQRYYEVRLRGTPPVSIESPFDRYVFSLRFFVVFFFFYRHDVTISACVVVFNLHCHYVLRVIRRYVPVRRQQLFFRYAFPHPCPPPPLIHPGAINL